MEPINLTELFFEEKIPEKVKGKGRVELLKALEALTRTIFVNNSGFSGLLNVLGKQNRSKVASAVLDQIWTGIEEYTEDFYRVLEVAVKRQNLQRSFVRAALDSLEHGFDNLDKLLIYQASIVGDLYEDWYRRFAQTVQGNETAKRLAADEREGKVPKELGNHYTVIVYEESSHSYSQIPNARYFKDEIGAIVAAFDRWIAELERCQTEKADVKEQYLVYLSAYRAALAETDVARLESVYTELDRKWMDIRYWIQIVHDIEYGYGDPLRCKEAGLVQVTPEFSVRLLDESFQKENDTIQKIQDHMVGYFKSRSGKLARDGITGLKKSMAGIYYLPFQQGVNLFFRFSGQSIPNRAEVRLSHGCKIYFDAVSTASREVFAQEVARQVCQDPAQSDNIDALGTIVYHVAAHEIGHAIYSLDSLKDLIRVSTKTLLEEPRAELTALHTLKLLEEKGFIDQAKVERSLASFMLQDLRRFVTFDSSATKPYLVSAMSNWARAERLGYLTVNPNGKVEFDESKVGVFLADCSRQFEAILEAEDRGDGAAIEAVLSEMEACFSAPIVQHLVGSLFSAKRAEASC